MPDDPAPAPGMSLTTYSFGARLAATDLVARHGITPIAIIGTLHLAAVGLMAWYEIFPVSRLAFVLIWGLLNFFWLALLRRPAIAAALSLILVSLVIVLSEFKFRVLWMTLNFLDVMIIDADSFTFLFTIFPQLWLAVGIAGAAIVPLLALLWWIDPLRVRLRTAMAGMTVCFAALLALAFTVQLEPFEAFYGHNHVSNFTRSGISVVSDLMKHGFLESDPVVADRLKSSADTTCQPAGKPPHIIMVHDESSFDIRSAPGVQVPPGYGEHFKSFDGRARHLLVEGIGGASWIAEYNVLTGLSARSFGRFSYFVTRIASGRVTRGLPNALRRCGYRTFSLYPSLGAFMSARSFQTTTGMQQFKDATDMGAKGLQPDSFFYDKATRLIESERGKGPMFLFVYLAANHFPWTYRFRPDLAPQWQDLGNPPVVNEFPQRIFPDRALRRSSAGFRSQDHGSVARREGGWRAADALRSEILHHLLCDRRDQFQTGGSLLRSRYARRALPAAGSARSRRAAARSVFRRAEEHLQALRRDFLCLQRGSRSPAVQSSPDRCWADQAAVGRRSTRM